MLRSVDWQLGTDVSGQSMGQIFKGQAVQSSWTELYVIGVLILYFTFQ